MLNPAIPTEDIFCLLSASSACEGADEINSAIPTKPIRKKKNIIRGRPGWFMHIALEVLRITLTVIRNAIANQHSRTDSQAAPAPIILSRCAFYLTSHVASYRMQE